MNKKNASALILVLTATTFLMIIMTVCWKKSSLLLDLVTTRHVYYKNLLLTQTALNWTTKIVSNNFELFLNQREKMPIFLDFSFLSKSSNQNIDVIINLGNQETNNKKVYLSAQMYEQNKSLCKLSCVISFDENLISQGRESGGFMVDGFTLSNFI